VNDSEIYSDSFCADFLTGFLDELVSELHCTFLAVDSKPILCKPGGTGHLCQHPLSRYLVGVSFHLHVAGLFK